MDQVRSDIAHLYRRAGFGATAAELDAATPAGYDAAVTGLVAGLSAADPGADAVSPPAMGATTGLAGPPGSAARQAQERQIGLEVAGIQQWWAARMVATSTPLREKLALIWHGHFATAVSKVRDASLMAEQYGVFRSAGAGNFADLTLAVAQGGAMIRWLDLGTDVDAHPNENFAREMMELFTRGLGNYGQDDVTAAARAFTGWTYTEVRGWEVRRRLHDDGLKTFLGQTGNWGGEDIIRMATADATSARFVVSALWSHLAYPVSPDDDVVTALLPSYGSGMDVGAVLDAALRRPEFVSTQARTGLVKQPVEWVVGSARALGLGASITPPSGRRPLLLSRVAAALGQELFDPPNVGGWGQNSYWLDTSTALTRLDAATAMAGAADLTAVSSAPAADRPDIVASMLSIDGWGPTTAAALGHAVGDPVSLVATALTAPEYVLA